MKNSILSIVISIVSSISMYAQELSPYVKIGTSNKSIEQVSEQVIKVLNNNSFTVLGNYHPAGNNN